MRYGLVIDRIHQLVGTHIRYFGRRPKVLRIGSNAYRCLLCKTEMHTGSTLSSGSYVVNGMDLKEDVCKDPWVMGVE